MIHRQLIGKKLILITHCCADGIKLQIVRGLGTVKQLKAGQGIGGGFLVRGRVIEKYYGFVGEVLTQRSGHVLFGTQWLSAWAGNRFSSILVRHRLVTVEADAVIHRTVPAAEHKPEVTGQ